jgi:predicted nucleotidyltransferase component of viral defense system
MTNKAMSLKAKIRNLAKKSNVTAQVILQNYMFERFLERLSYSKYKNNFVLKGGILIAALVGISNRSTMDMDATVKNYPIEANSLIKAIKEICNINLLDDVIFLFLRIEAIRDKDRYGGYRAEIKANFDDIITPLTIDITAGDAITPKAIFYPYKTIFHEKIIEIWAYNIETILAEKVETILQRAELNTRPRDFYDIYILVNTQEFNEKIFIEALNNTLAHRKTQYLIDNCKLRVKAIEESETLKERWLKYSQNYPYAKRLTYEETITILKKLLKNFM